MAMQASSSGRVGSAPRQMKETSSSSAPSTPVRENFPETWFWVDFVKRFQGMFFSFDLTYVEHLVGKLIFYLFLYFLNTYKY